MDIKLGVSSSFNSTESQTETYEKKGKKKIFGTRGLMCINRTSCRIHLPKLKTQTQNRTRSCVSETKKTSPPSLGLDVHVSFAQSQVAQAPLLIYYKCVFVCGHGDIVNKCYTLQASVWFSWWHVCLWACQWKFSLLLVTLGWFWPWDEFGSTRKQIWWFFFVLEFVF